MILRNCVNAKGNPLSVSVNLSNRQFHQVNLIETEVQLSVIQQSGCDQLQGNVISEPLFPAEFERLVANFLTEMPLSSIASFPS